MMLGHLHCHHFNRTCVVKAPALADVQLVWNSIQLLLAIYGQICAFGQILANQAIGILVTPALPQAMRVAEMDSHPGTG